MPGRHRLAASPCTYWTTYYPCTPCTSPAQPHRLRQRLVCLYRKATTAARGRVPAVAPPCSWLYYTPEQPKWLQLPIRSQPPASSLRSPQPHTNHLDSQQSWSEAAAAAAEAKACFPCMSPVCRGPAGCVPSLCHSQAGAVPAPPACSTQSPPSGCCSMSALVRRPSGHTLLAYVGPQVQTLLSSLPSLLCACRTRHLFAGKLLRAWRTSHRSVRPKPVPLAVGLSTANPDLPATKSTSPRQRFRVQRSSSTATCFKGMVCRLRLLN